MKKTHPSSILRSAALVFTACLSTLIQASAATTSAVPLKVLVIGSTNPISPSFFHLGLPSVYGEKAFAPDPVATNLQAILANDLSLSNRVISVTSTNINQTQTFTPVSGTTNTVMSRSLMSWFYWPNTHTQTLNLLSQPWDFVVMIDDPFVASHFPEYSFEGVNAIASKLQNGSTKPLLLMTWSSTSTPLSVFGEMAYRVGAGTGVQVVPAGYAWGRLSGKVTGTGSRPNLQGAYLSAATIYSQIFNRSATNSSYVPPTLSRADRDTIAAAAFASVVQEASKSHFSGIYNGPTHLIQPADKKLSLNYTDFNSSTEWLIRQGMQSVVSVCGLKFNPTIASGYQALVTNGFPYDFCQDRFYEHANTNYWKNFATFDYEDNYGTNSMVAGVDRVMYGVDPNYNIDTNAVPNIEQESSAYDVLSNGYLANGEFFVPLRVLWSRIRTAHPEIPCNKQGDVHHLSAFYNQGVAEMMSTLLTGRSSVGIEPADKTNADWQYWFCRKTGYELAWQFATLQSRLSGLEVFKTSSNTLSVRFLYPPTASVVVKASTTPNVAATPTVSPQTLTFTSTNYSTFQTVQIVGGAPGIYAPFNVNFTTTSTDSVFNGLTDQWQFNQP